MLGRQRLGIGHVEDRGESTGGDLRDQRRGRPAPPGRVHQGCAVDHRRQLGRGDHPLRLGEGRRVQADDVGGGEELVEGHQPHTEPGGVRLVEVGVADHHLEAVRREQGITARPTCEAPTRPMRLPQFPTGRRRGRRRQRDAPGPLPLEEGGLVRPEDRPERVLGHRHRVGRGAGGDAGQPGEGGRGGRVAERCRPRRPASPAGASGRGGPRRPRCSPSARAAPRPGRARCRPRRAGGPRSRRARARRPPRRGQPGARAASA